jgi:hypothetical protein
MENAACLLHLTRVLEGVETHLMEAGFDTSAADLTDLDGHKLLVAFRTKEGLVSTVFGLGKGPEPCAYEILGGVAFYDRNNPPESKPKTVEAVVWDACLCEKPEEVGEEIGSELVGWVLANYRSAYWSDDEDGPCPMPARLNPDNPDHQAFAE